MSHPTSHSRPFDLPAPPTACVRSAPLFPLLPLLAPPPLPRASIASSFPARPLTSALPGYIYTRHVLSAAYPRSTLLATSPPAPKSFREQWPVVDRPTEPKDERAERITRETEDLIMFVREGDSPDGRPKPGERVGEALDMGLGRFWKEGGPTKDKRAVTLMLATGNGFPPEHWILPMKHLLDKMPSSASMEIIEIWLLYTPLFDPRAGPSYMWSEHARDVTSFVLHYLPLAPTQALSARLERRDDPARRSNIVAASHSYTAAATLQAELERARLEGPDGPGLFDALLLVDPMIVDPVSAYGKAGNPSPMFLINGAMRRQDIFDSKDAAKAILLRTPFYQTFHPGQLDAYVEHGLVPLEGSNSPKVTLRIPRILEAIVYSSQMAGEIWNRLYHGEKTGAKCKEVRFMFAGEGAVTGTPEQHAKLAHFLGEPSPVDGRRSIASNVIIPGAGHAILEMKPEEVGEDLLDLLLRHFTGREGLSKLCPLNPNELARVDPLLATEKAVIGPLDDPGLNPGQDEVVRLARGDICPLKNPVEPLGNLERRHVRSKV